MNTKNNKNDISFSSNSVRLSLKQWILVAAFCITAVVLTPVLWKKIEKFSPGQDYRQPYNLSSDYWLYRRYSDYACSRYDTLIIGDSVIWGHYVSKNNTLSHYLNESAGENKFANLGADGMHPAALEGLVRYYGKEIKNKNVILHLNPLWMSSPLADLQTEKEFNFNHPKLVAQFTPEIPCYSAKFKERLSITIRRQINFTSWISHLNIAYFENMDLPSWTIENPYKNPLEAVDFNLPVQDIYEKSDRDDSAGEDTEGSNFQWVQAETSIQWKFFRRTIQLLQKRKNRLFVLVGPFNEHKLDSQSRESYLTLKGEIELWLSRNNIAYFAPGALPAELYNDASHPNAEGYRILSQQILENDVYLNFIGK